MFIGRIFFVLFCLNFFLETAVLVQYMSIITKNLVRHFLLNKNFVGQIRTFLHRRIRFLFHIRFRNHIRFLFRIRFLWYLHYRGRNLNEVEEGKKRKIFQTKIETQAITYSGLAILHGKCHEILNSTLFSGLLYYVPWLLIFTCSEPFAIFSLSHRDTLKC
jgi:hypothetical protein